MTIKIPKPSIAILIVPSGSGKSTLASSRFKPLDAIVRFDRRET
jgi:ABC-type phosphate transport system ATPase subunit